MRIAVGADHAGVPLNKIAIAGLRSCGHEVVDLGSHNPSQPDDYPDYAVSVAEEVTSGRCERGLLICGSGVGVSVAANKVPGIRAAMCHDTYSAHQGVEHDNMNVLCLGARVIGSELMLDVVRTFLAAHFTGEERHRRRLEKVVALERRFSGEAASQASQSKSHMTTTKAAGPEKELSNMNTIRATRLLHDHGQSLWLDNITRALLDTGTLRRYIDEFSITGLTSNPTIFDHAIKNSSDYDVEIRKGIRKGKSEEALFFDMALEDLIRAADLFRPVHEKTDGVDGWVSLEVSPLLAHDTAATVAAAKELFARADRPNLFIKIPGTKEGLPAIEESIFAGVPVNVTLLFSREQYLGAAEAFLRGIERRIKAGLNPNVGSVASVFVSRWDVAVANKVPDRLRNQLGIAIAKRTYKAAAQLGSDRWRRIYNSGARQQRLLWASTGTKDPNTSEVLYVNALAAPFTVNTMPEGTLKAVAGRHEIGPMLTADGGDCEEVIAEFTRHGIDVDALAAKLQDEGAESFVKSWKDLLSVISSRCASIGKSAPSTAA
jgi:transaldolase